MSRMKVRHFLLEVFLLFHGLMYKKSVTPKNRLTTIFFGGKSMKQLKKMTIHTIVGIIMIVSLCSFSTNDKVEAFSPQVIQHGAVGEDVIELQARLKHIGFYHGKVDGVFGWSTYWALRNFQYEFGMEIDGIAGAKVKDKLARATEFDRKKVQQEMYGTKQPSTTPKKQQTQKQPQSQTQDKAESTAKQETGAVNVPQGFSQNDIKLMANAVHGEARGEPYEGQVAVAAVILNRTKSGTFPNTISGVIFEPRAFTAVADGQIWLTPNETAERAVLDAINGWDPTGNATYYFNPDTATSEWIWSRPQIKRIGKHIFCK